MKKREGIGMRGGKRNLSPLFFWKPNSISFPPEWCLYTFFLANYIHLLSGYFCAVLHLCYALKDKYIQHKYNSYNPEKQENGHHLIFDVYVHICVCVYVF